MPASTAIHRALFPWVVAIFLAGTCAGASAAASTPAPDSFVQQGSKLVGNSTNNWAGQGASVAVSSDGSTAIVGGPSDNGYQGAAWVFTRSGGTWTQQAKLVGSGAVPSGYNLGQGTSVALSGDGNTALVANPADNGDIGAVWVFVRSGTTWTQQAELVGSIPGPYFTDWFGSSVALSGDGNTAIIGAPGDNPPPGCIAGYCNTYGGARVFTRSGTTWTQQADFAGDTIEGGFGGSVALSSDGTTALVGETGVNDSVGEAVVFARSGATWTQQGELAAAADAGAVEGSSLALSTDGSTAIIGGPGADSGVGAAWVFIRSAGTWTQQTKLVGSGAVSFSAGRYGQGGSVSLSADGDTALVGSVGDVTYSGAVWVFARSGTTWTQQGSKLHGSGAVGTQVFQGSSVALSGDGSTAIVGGPGDNSGAGAAWVFVRPLLLSVVSVAADDTQLDAADVTVGLMSSPKGSGGCDANATYSFADDDLQAVADLGSCRYRLTFDQPATGIYHVGLTATVGGQQLKVSLDQYDDKVNGTFPVVIDSCSSPVENVPGVDALSDAKGSQCAVEVGAWDGDAGSIPAKVIDAVERQRDLAITPVRVDQIDPSDLSQRDLTALRTAGVGWVPTGNTKVLAEDVAVAGNVAALVKRAKPPGTIPSAWRGSDTELTEAQLGDKAPATVISAHGYWLPPNGLIRVPAGDHITTWVPIGTVMDGWLGLHVDTGHIIGLDRRYEHIYGPGQLMPNFTFVRFEGTTGKHVINPSRPVTLDDLVRADEHRIWISACATVYLPAGETPAQAQHDIPVYNAPSTKASGTATTSISNSGQLVVWK